MDWAWAQHCTKCHCKCCWTSQLWSSETGEFSILGQLSWSYSFWWSCFYAWLYGCSDNVLTFNIFILMQTILNIPGFSDNVLTHLLAGLGAGFFAVCIGSPIDVVGSWSRLHLLLCLRRIIRLITSDYLLSLS